MPIDAHVTPWTPSRPNGMRWPRTTLAAVALSLGLTGCSWTPEKQVVTRLVTDTCPRQAPARLCPAKPVHPAEFAPHTAMQFIIDLLEWGDCHASRDADWQQLLIDCHEPR